MIYVDGKRIEETVFISPEKLTAPLEEAELTSESVVEVCQTGKDRIVLSSVRVP